MSDGKFNVASHACVTGPIDQLWQRFVDAGFADRWLPNDEGWMPIAPFSGQVMGRVAIRDALAAQIEQVTGRTTPYTRAQMSNLMREADVLARCTWPVQSIPAISVPSLEAIAVELVELKPRRNRQPATDQSSGWIVDRATN